MFTHYRIFWGDKMRDFFWGGGLYTQIFGQMKNYLGVSTWKPKGNAHLEDLGTDGRKYLEGFCKEQNRAMWNIFMWLRIWG